MSLTANDSQQLGCKIAAFPARYVAKLQLKMFGQGLNDLVVSTRRGRRSFLDLWHPKNLAKPLPSGKEKP